MHLFMELIMLQISTGQSELKNTLTCYLEQFNNTDVVNIMCYFSQMEQNHSTGCNSLSSIQNGSDKK